MNIYNLTLENIIYRIKRFFSKKKNYSSLELIDTKKDITEKDIKRYYRMYSNKFDIDSKKEWNTSKKYTYYEYKQEVDKCKKESNESAWVFMISRKTDMFVGFPPNITYMSYRNYDF